MTDKTGSARIAAGRIEMLDLARGIALIAMATYHFSWDLELFGYLDPGTANQGFLKLYARAIAGSFLLIAGFSLVLAQFGGLRLEAFARRILIVAGAAAVITVATWFATPDSYIFFGILHAIATFSLIGLVFLRAPIALIVSAAIVCLALPQVFRSDLFNIQWLSFVGLSTVVPRSNDYVPLFPWFGLFLLGMAAARFSIRAGALDRFAAIRTGENIVGRGLRACGRHSLAFYLVHQPVLLALVWSAAQIAPPAPVDPVSGFVADCQRGCVASNEMDFCQRFCACVTDELISRDIFSAYIAGDIDPETDPRIQDIGQICSAPTGE